MSLLRLSRVRLSCVLVLALSLTACGGMQFDRTSGAYKYRALPMGAEVSVAASAQALPQPTVDIGGLAWKVETRTQPQADEAKALERFKRHAARYGCDAVVAMKATTSEQKSTKKVKKMGPEGKYVYEAVETTLYTHAYSARCVRSAKAPGGLVEAGQTAAPAEAPTTPTTPTKPPSSSGGVSPRKAPEKREKVEKDVDVGAVWLALSPYGNNLLKNWKRALDKPPASAHDVLAAFSELMVQVSGPTGIWRKTVPNDWFGCPANPAQEQCTKLKVATAEFRAWDTLQRSMERQSPESARGWIKRNRRRLMGYLARYVPQSPNLTGLQQTPLYLDKVR